ncbi:MAG: SGNH/GDSL hydrolase family protein [Candidatus Bruticola sp.]
MEDTAFYIVSGGETALSSQYLIGNIPRLLDNQIIASLLLGFTIAALLCKLSQVVAQKYSGWARLSLFKRNLLVTFLFFVIFEAMLHLPYYSPSKLFIPDPLTFWKANPEATANERGRRTNMVGTSRTSISGIFDQEHPRHKNSNTFRITVLGDSQAISAFRHQYAPKHCYPKVLQNNLNRRQAQANGHRHIEVIDGAISGYSSWQGLMLYKSDIAPYKPDMVIEAFGYHDANEAFSTDRSVITDNKWIHYLRSWIYRSRICILVRSLSLRLHSRSMYSRRSGDVNATERVPLSEFIENIKNFYKLSQEDGFQLVLLLEPTNRHIANSSQLPLYHEALRRLAAEYNIMIIDAPQIFASLPPQQYDRLFADSVHFTPEGHRFMAKIVEEALIKNDILEN